MSSQARPGWPEVVGYRHEVLHTGVLAYLLDDPSRGPAVAEALTGAPVTAIEWVASEDRLPGHRGRADLVSEIRLNDGRTAHLAVETKVDSNASRRQLRATAAPPDRGVLLALGITALHLTQDDLGENLPGWRSVGPAEWAAVLRRVGANDDQLLAPYVESVQEEAAQHARARGLADSREGGVSLSDGRRGDGLLEHFAWLAEIRDAMRDRHAVMDEWWVYTNRSGPLMGLLREDFQRYGRETFLEFVCTGHRRRLCLKLGKGDGSLREAAAATWAQIASAGWQPGARAPHARAGTCTAAEIDLTGFLAGEAASRTQEAIREVAGEGRR